MDISGVFQEKYFAIKSNPHASKSLGKLQDTIILMQVDNIDVRNLPGWTRV